MHRIPCIFAFAVWAAFSTANAEKVPVAVLWLDGPNDAVDEVARALAEAKQVRPIDGAEARQLLVEGGPRARAERRLAAARAAFSTGRCGEAAPDLDAAEEAALGELPVADGRALLGDVAAVRLMCADLARDDAAAARAAELYAASGAHPSTEIAAALARHPLPPPSAQPAVRVESDPAGATVYLDFVAVGKTPLDLPTERRAGAFVDVELPGHRRAHRAAPSGGTLALALAREDAPGALVDRIRAAAGAADDSYVAALGRRVGAARLLVARIKPGAPDRLQARVLDVATAKWTAPAFEIPRAACGPALVEKATTVEKKTAPAPPPAPETPAWKRWYTWVAAGVLAAVVIGIVVANHVGTDELDVTVHK